jgi:mono/diheme cytochrome c family protein
MKIVATYFLFIFTIVALYGFAFSINQPEPADNKPDGKKVFTDNKCAACHNIESEGIIKKTSSAKTTPPDLSKIGTKLNQTNIVNYLKKKELINDKKHPAVFKGTDDELNAMVKWLVNLKKSEPVKVKKTEPVK